METLNKQHGMEHEVPESTDARYDQPLAKDRSFQINGAIYGNVFHTYDTSTDSNAEWKIRSVLTATNSKVDRDNLQAVNQRVDGTCEWILQDALFRHWVETPQSQILWLRGPPATGKTVMALYLIDTLEGFSNLSPDSSSAVIWFFCSPQGSNGVRNSAPAILRGLYSQLIALQPDLLSLLEAEFSRDDPIGDLFDDANKEIRWNNLVRALEQFKRQLVYVVIDGLDECDSQSIRWIARKFDDLTSTSSNPASSKLKLVVTSRDMRDEVPDIFPNQLCLDLDPLYQQNVVGDINRMIDDRVSQLARDLPWLRRQPEVKAHVVQLLEQRAAGTFLWVRFMIDEIRAADLSTVETVLGRMPRGLDAFYEGILASIRPDNRLEVCKILRWCSFATRPLSLAELAAATGIRNSRYGSVEERIEGIVKNCKSLLQLRRHQGTVYVHFIHSSARTFLEKLKQSTYPALADFVLEREAAHLQIAQVCLKYIQPELCLRAVDLTTPASPIYQQYPLFEYACRNWPSHAARSGPGVVDMIKEVPLFCEKRSVFRSNWLRTYWSLENHGMDMPATFEMTHLTAFFGISPLLSDLMGKPPLFRRLPRPAVTILGKMFRSHISPLDWACRNGHLECVNILLRGGADVNSNGFGMTPLAWAARNGHHRIVRVLLKHGARSSTMSYGLTPLHWASLYGKSEAVEALLNSPGDINRATSSGMYRYLDALDTLRRVSDNAPLKLESKEFPWGSVSVREASVLSETMTVREKVQMRIIIKEASSILCHLLIYVWRLLLRKQMCVSVYGPVEAKKMLPILWGLGGTCLRGDEAFENSVRAILWLFLPRNILEGLMNPETELGAWIYFLFVLLVFVTCHRSGWNSISRLFLIMAKRASIVCLYPLEFLFLGQQIIEVVLGSCHVWWMFQEKPYGQLLGRLWEILMGIIFFLFMERRDRVGLYSLPIQSILFTKLVLLVLYIGGYFFEPRVAGHNTALHLACAGGHDDVVCLLLKNGANTGPNRKTDLADEFSFGHIQTLHTFLKHYLLPTVDSLDDSYSVGQLAAMSGSTRLMSQVGEAGSNVLQRSSRGWTPIHSAVYARDHAMVSHLIGLGADVHATSKEGVTPLMVSAFRNCPLSASVLLEKGAMVNETTNEGITALQISVWSGNLDVTKLLLKRGADISLRDRQGYSAVDLAEGDTAMKDLLVQHSSVVSNVEATESNQCLVRVGVRPIDSLPAGITGHSARQVQRLTIIKTIRQLAEEFLRDSLENRQFEWLGYYLHRIDDLQRAKTAYEWARAPETGIPWYFCQACCNNEHCGRAWACKACRFTFTQPILCNTCYYSKRRGSSSPLLPQCRIDHDFLEFEVYMREENPSLDVIQRSWLQDLLHSGPSG